MPIKKEHVSIVVMTTTDKGNIERLQQYKVGAGSKQYNDMMERYWEEGSVQNSDVHSVKVCAKRTHYCTRVKL